MRNEPGRSRRRKSLVRIGCANALAAILAVGLATPSLADKRHRHHPGHGHHGHRAAVFPGLGLSSLAQHHFRAHRHWHGRRLPPGVHRPRPTVVYVLPGVRYAAPAAVPARIAVARRPAAAPDCRDPRVPDTDRRRRQGSRGLRRCVPATDGGPGTDRGDTDRRRRQGSRGLRRCVPATRRLLEDRTPEGHAAIAARRYSFSPTPGTSSVVRARRRVRDIQG